MSFVQKGVLANDKPEAKQSIASPMRQIPVLLESLITMPLLYPLQNQQQKEEETEDKRL